MKLFLWADSTHTENQSQMARAGKTDISHQMWKISHTKHTFLSSVYNFIDPKPKF